MQMMPSAEAIGQGDCEGVQDNRRAHIRDLCILHPCGDTQQGFRFRIGRLENETREISRKMNDVLTRAACDFEDDTRHRQDISKDIENEIAIADCRRRVLAVIGHFLAHSTWLWLRLRHATSLQRFLVIRSRRLRHGLIVASLSQPCDLSGRDENALSDRLGFALQ